MRLLNAEAWKSKLETVVFELFIVSESGPASYSYPRKLNIQVEASPERHFITGKLGL